MKRACEAQHSECSCGAGAFAQAQIEIENRARGERIENNRVPAFGRSMREQKPGCTAWIEVCRGKGRNGDDKTVNENGAPSLRSRDDGSREGRDFEVVDAKSGDDITHQVLTQIIVEEEARGSTMLPVNFLRQLIGLYGGSMQSAVPQYLEAAMDAFSKNQEAMRDAFGGKAFADLAKRNMAMFEEAGRAFTGGAQKPAEKDRATEVEKLRAELAALQEKVERLAK